MLRVPWISLRGVAGSQPGHDYLLPARDHIGKLQGNTFEARVLTFKSLGAYRQKQHPRQENNPQSGAGVVAVAVTRPLIPNRLAHPQIGNIHLDLAAIAGRFTKKPLGGACACCSQCHRTVVILKLFLYNDVSQWHGYGFCVRSRMLA